MISLHLNRFLFSSVVVGDPASVENWAVQLLEQILSYPICRGVHSAATLPLMMSRESLPIEGTLPKLSATNGAVLWNGLVRTSPEGLTVSS